MRYLIVSLGVILSVLLYGISFAEGDRIDVETVVAATGSTLIAVANNNTVYSKSFSTKQVSRLAICDLIYSSLPAVKITLQQSFDRPVTEGNSDIKYMDTYVSIPIRTAKNKWQVATIDTMTVLPYSRFKLQGIESNTSDTTIQLKVGKQ